MATRPIRRSAVGISLLGALVSFVGVARADVPAGYQGRPFDPATAGGPKLPAGVQGGPYAIPGRIDFVNYDMGGDGVAYHVSEHAQRGGTGYRIDTPTATLSLTSDCIANGGGPPCQNVWYDTSAALDGTPYPTATTADFNLGAIHTGDWFDFTVNVATAGVYSLSSTWATGSGPPGGEGGNGDMGLTFLSNNTMLSTWSTVFPNYTTEADYHHWRAYPDFATVTLSSGLQVIQIKAGATAMQLDYIEFALATDGGTSDADAGSSGSIADASVPSGSPTGSSGSQSGASAGSTGTSGPASGSPSTSGAVGTSGDMNAATGAPAGSGASAGTAAPGTAGGVATAGSGASATATPAAKGNGCALAAAGRGPGLVFGFALVVAGLVRRRRPE
jgi:hypothetical protein